MQRVMGQSNSCQFFFDIEISWIEGLQQPPTCCPVPYLEEATALCLEDLKVISCRSIEIIYEGDGMDTESGELRWLYLHDLENLRHIWQFDGLPNIPFPNLREIEVVGCSRLETLFPTFTAKFLGQIEELVVESCENMELIADHEKGEEGIYTTITFSKLTLLKLFKLPKFRSFLPEKYSLKFPCSEDLEHFPSLQVWSIESCGAEPNQVLVDWEKHYLERLRRKFPWDQNLRWQWWLPRLSPFLRHSPSPSSSIHQQPPPDMRAEKGQRTKSGDRR